MHGQSRWNHNTLVPPLQGGAAQIRDCEADAGGVVAELRTVISKLLLQFAEPIIDLEAHLAFEGRGIADAGQLRWRGGRCSASTRRMLCCSCCSKLLLLRLIQLHDLSLQLRDGGGVSCSCACWSGNGMARRRLRRPMGMQLLLLHVAHADGGRWTDDDTKCLEMDPKPL